MMLSAHCAFTKRERVSKRAEFIKIYNKGVKKESRHFKTILLVNNLQWSRLGLTVSKKVGKAVQRNAVKRRLREYFRLHKAFLAEPCDIVIICKPGAQVLTYAEMCEELNSILKTNARPADNAGTDF